MYQHRLFCPERWLFLKYFIMTRKTQMPAYLLVFFSREFDESIRALVSERAHLFELELTHVFVSRD